MGIGAEGLLGGTFKFPLDLSHQIFARLRGVQRPWGRRSMFAAHHCGSCGFHAKTARFGVRRSGTTYLELSSLHGPLVR